MATFSVTTTAKQDAAVVKHVNKLNAKLRPEDTPVTLLEWVRSAILRQLDQLVIQYDNEERISKAELYQRASDADKARIDEILASYV